MNSYRVLADDQYSYHAIMTVRVYYFCSSNRLSITISCLTLGKL